MDARLVAAVLTDNRRAEVQTGARLLREQEGLGSTPHLPDLMEVVEGWLSVIYGNEFPKDAIRVTAQ
jgi:hypothetical protein